MIELYNGDCIEEMQKIEDNSVDLVLCDLPYGTTKCAWDIVIPFESLWKEYHRVAKDGHTPFVLFGTMPFVCKLWESNPNEFKHDWIWEKSRSGSAITAKYRPIKIHEQILVFSKETPNYFPIMEVGDPYSRKTASCRENNHQFGINGNVITENFGTRYPKTIRYVKQNWSKQQQVHPTQKPVELMEYLIETYSREGDVVLDSCMGSGTTGVACKNTNRSFIGIEKDETYFKIAKERIGE